MADEETAPDELDEETVIETEQDDSGEDETDDEADLEVEEEDGDESEGEDEDEGDEVDLEFAFGKYKVPAKLRDDVLGLQKKFTQTTQEFSKTTRELEERANARAEANEAYLSTKAELIGIDQQLAKYKDVDWVAISQQDPMAFNEHSAYVRQLEQRKTALDGELKQSEATRAQETQQELAKRVEETNAFAAKEIPNWTPELNTTLYKFAIEQGVPEQTLSDNWGPVLFTLLHRAQLGEQVLNKKATVPKPAKDVAKPLKTVKAKGSPPPKGLDDRLSIEEWVRRRNSQVSGG